MCWTCGHVISRDGTWWHVTCCPIWSNLWQLEGIRTLEECTWEEEPNIQWLTQATTTKLGKAKPQWLRQFHLNTSQYISIPNLPKSFWLFLVLWDVIWNLAMSVAMSVAGQNVVWQPFLVNLNNLARTEWSCTNRVRSKSFFWGGSASFFGGFGRFTVAGPHLLTLSPFEMIFAKQFHQPSPSSKSKRHSKP
jgi:hypothetical protein